MLCVYLDFYNCSADGCAWSDYIEDVDWGYFSKVDGDCIKCRENCSNDVNCGALECGKNYCSWWKVGRFSFFFLLWFLLGF